MIKDKNGTLLKTGDVFDINQTVNGQSEFFVFNIDTLDIRYNFDHRRKYEYSVQQLFEPCRFTGEVDFVIIK
jgi:hypothetical protein